MDEVSVRRPTLPARLGALLPLESYLDRGGADDHLGRDAGGVPQVIALRLSGAVALELPGRHLPLAVWCGSGG